MSESPGTVLVGAKLQGDFFNLPAPTPPPTEFDVGRRATDFKKKFRVLDCPLPPMVGKFRSVWESECDSNTSGGPVEKNHPEYKNDSKNNKKNNFNQSSTSANLHCSNGEIGRK